MAIFTFWASVGLHSTVGEHVPFQIIISTKWLAALDTTICPFPAVHFHVLLHISQTIKRLFTFWTNVQPSTTVHEHMFRHFTSVLDGALTTVAFYTLTGWDFSLCLCTDFNFGSWNIRTCTFSTFVLNSFFKKNYLSHLTMIKKEQNNQRWLIWPV